MNRRHVVVLSLVLLSSCGAGPSGRPLPSTPGAVERSLYEPRVVLARAARLHLDGATAAAIRADAVDTQAHWDETAARLHVATVALAVTLQTPHVDEAQAAARGADVMRLEDELKAAHLALLVRVKNRLTPAQCAMLDGR